MIVLWNLKQENAFKETLVPSANTGSMKPVLSFFARVREWWKEEKNCSYVQEVPLGVNVVKECEYGALICTIQHSHPEN